jgi:uncharacterized protein (TIGR00304 family)
MRPLRAVAWLVIALSMALIALALILGQLKAALFIVFPVLYGVGLLAAAAILLLFVGILLLFASAVPGAETAPENERTGALPAAVEQKKSKFGGVVLIGPIPIVFGSDRSTALWAMVIMAVVLVALALLLLFWPFGNG